MKKDMDHMKVKVDQMLKSVTTVAREGRLQQNAIVKNVIIVLPSASQLALSNPLYGVPLDFHP